MQLELPIEEEDACPSTKPEKRRGFASMDPARVRELARRGGLAAHRSGAAHRFTKEEARIAGRKGGVAPHVSRGRQQRARA